MREREREREMLFTIFLVVTLNDVEARVAADKRAAEGLELTQKIMVSHSHNLKALRKATYIHHAIFDQAIFLVSSLVVSFSFAADG